MVAADLAGEADAGHGVEAPGGEEVFFGLGHRVGFAGEELDAAGRAAGVAAAGVELVGFRFVGEGVDEAFVLRDLEGSDGFDGELGHGGRVYGPKPVRETADVPRRRLECPT